MLLDNPFTDQADDDLGGVSRGGANWAKQRAGRRDDREEANLERNSSHERIYCPWSTTSARLDRVEPPSLDTSARATISHQIGPFE